MTRKRLRCRLGFHAYVTRHPVDEKPQGPDQKVCRLCGKRTGVPYGSVPAAGIEGGGGGFA